MAKEIVSFTSLSEADVNSVLISLTNGSSKETYRWQNSTLGKLDNFYPALSIEESEKSENVSVKTSNQ